MTANTELVLATLTGNNGNDTFCFAYLTNALFTARQMCGGKTEDNT